MFELVLITLALLMLRHQLAAFEGGHTSSGNLGTRRTNPQLIRLVEYANRLFSERKWLAAEKAYLSVLKLDHKNATAYSHLGIIYSTQKNFPDAIECFQIAARIQPSGVTYQNLGLAYYENRNYIKSIAAFEKAIMFEPTAQRYIGLSKAQAKLKNPAHSLTALQKAAELDPSKRILQLLAEAYDEVGQTAAATATRQRITAATPTPPPSQA